MVTRVRLPLATGIPVSNANSTRHPEGGASDGFGGEARDHHVERPGGCGEFHTGVAGDQLDPVPLGQLVDTLADLVPPGGVGVLHPPEVIGVIDDSRRIAVAIGELE